MDSLYCMTFYVQFWWFAICGYIFLTKSKTLKDRKTLLRKHGSDHLILLSFQPNQSKRSRKTMNYFQTGLRTSHEIINRTCSTQVFFHPTLLLDSPLFQGTPKPQMCQKQVTFEFWFYRLARWEEKTWQVKKKGVDKGFLVIAPTVDPSLVVWRVRSK